METWYLRSIKQLGRVKSKEGSLKNQKSAGFSTISGIQTKF